MLASEVIKRYEAYCPQELSMEGDVRGLQVGTLQKDIHKVMVALDIREQTVAEAIAHGVDLIIVKHAPIFRPIKDLVADRAQNQIYIDLIKHDIAVYVSHTNIDIVPDGLNDWFCQLLEIEDTEPLSMTGEGLGIGRWTKPRGGYFISFDSLEGCAKDIVARCKKAGVVMTSAGATYPYGKDPHDSNIRIAPTYPTLGDLITAAELFALCVKLSSVEKLLKTMA